MSNILNNGLGQRCVTDPLKWKSVSYMAVLVFCLATVTTSKLINEFKIKSIFYVHLFKQPCNKQNSVPSASHYNKINTRFIRTQIKTLQSIVFSYNELINVMSVYFRSSIATWNNIQLSINPFKVIYLYMYIYSVCVCVCVVSKDF